jgi:hypothetical protein
LFMMRGSVYLVKFRPLAMKRFPHMTNGGFNMANDRSNIAHG